MSLVNRGKTDVSHLQHVTAALVSREEGPDDISMSWKAFALSCEPTINELLNAYMDIIFPLLVLRNAITRSVAC